jgi:hypothetical protein
MSWGLISHKFRIGFSHTRSIENAASCSEAANGRTHSPFDSHGAFSKNCLFILAVLQAWGLDSGERAVVKIRSIRCAGILPASLPTEWVD